MFASPECAAFAARHFAGRPLQIVSSGGFAAALANCDARSATFCGLWPQLTVDVSRALAEWADQDSERGCGVFAAPGADEAPACNTALARTVYHLTSVQATESALGVRRATDPEEIVTRLLDPEHARPVGLALTGHGAEYCIQLGSRWLATFDAVMLGTSDRIVRPRQKLADLIFLNSCSSLRLGDSCVPEQYSLARRLFALDSSIIGSFRNHHTSRLRAGAFIEAVLRGEPHGRVVNRLNDYERRFGAGPLTFQLLGDAAAVSCTSEAIPDEVTAPLAPPLPSGAVLKRAIADAGWLDLLFATLARWTPVTENTRSSNERLVEASTSANLGLHALRMRELESSDVTRLANAVDSELRASRQTTLEEIAGFIQQKTWLQSAYAIVSGAPKTSESRCGRCGRTSVRARYQPVAPYLLPVYREDCDRCGTTIELIGQEEEPTRVAIGHHDQGITLTIAPLATGAHGLIFFHRMPHPAPWVWPAGGGVLSIPLSTLSFAGRLTLVAAELHARRLLLQYHTFFVDPGV